MCARYAVCVGSVHGQHYFHPLSVLWAKALSEPIRSVRDGYGHLIPRICLLLFGLPMRNVSLTVCMLCMCMAFDRGITSPSLALNYHAISPRVIWLRSSAQGAVEACSMRIDAQSPRNARSSTTKNWLKWEKRVRDNRYRLQCNTCSFNGHIMSG